MDHLEPRIVALQVLEARSKSSDPYNALLLPKTASFRDARAAYKRLFFLHPDKNPNLDIAAEAFKIITSAFESIKASTAQLDSFRSEFDASAAPVMGNRWSAYTGSAPAPGGGTAPRPGSSMQPQQAAQPSIPAASKWGRPSTDVQRLLKVHDPPSGVNSAVEATTGLWKAPPHTENEPSRHRRPSDPTNEKRHLQANSNLEEGHDIASESFYGESSRKKAKGTGSWSPGHIQKSSLAGSNQTAEGVSLPGPTLGVNQSRWSNANKDNPLSELLRNPGAASLNPVPPGDTDRKIAAVQKRPSKKRQENGDRRRRKPGLVIESDSEDAIEDSSRDNGHQKSGNSSSSAGWDSDEFSSDGCDKPQQISKRKKKEQDMDPPENHHKDDSKNLLSLLLAQKESEAKEKLRTGLVAAQRARGAAAVRRAFGRRGKRRTKQTKLKLAPVLAG